MSKFQSKTLEGTFVGYGAESHTYRVYDKTSRFFIESSSVAFEENDGSQVAQFHVSNVDVETSRCHKKNGRGIFSPH